MTNLDLRDMVAEYLSRHGFAVRTAADGVQLEAFLATEPADSVLLDINMPGEDGLSIARRMLAGSGVPFIMLTAVGDPVDRIIGLELGADDYIAKPFDLRELRARVRSVLRRTARPIASNASGAAVASGERVSFGAVALDLAARCLLHPDGRVSKLTAMEFDLLRTFAENPNRVLTRDRLLDLAHHRDWSRSTAASTSVSPVSAARSRRTPPNRRSSRLSTAPDTCSCRPEHGSAGGVEGHCARADFSKGKSVLTIVPLFGRSGTCWLASCLYSREGPTHFRVEGNIRPRGEDQAWQQAGHIRWFVATSGSRACCVSA